MTALLAKPESSGKLKINRAGAAQVAELLSAFLHERIPLVNTPKDLAVRMAALARLIRTTILNALNDEEETGALHMQMDGFRKVFLHDLEAEQFADMYAQTICYGLFAAHLGMTFVPDARETIDVHGGWPINHGPSSLKPFSRNNLKQASTTSAS